MDENTYLQLLALYAGMGAPVTDPLYVMTGGR